MTDALTAKQRRFAAEYPKDLNATRAAVRAGYSKKAAHVLGTRLLGNPKVAALIAQREEKALAKAEITVDGTLEQLRRVLHFDIAEIYDDEGNLLPVKRWPEPARAAIAGVETEHHPERGTRVAKVRIADRLRAIDLAMKHLGLLVERHEVTGANGGPIQVEDARERALDLLDDIARRAAGGTAEKGP